MFLLLRKINENKFAHVNLAPYLYGVNQRAQRRAKLARYLILT